VGVSSSLRDRVQADLRTAMKEQAPERVSVLRTTLAAIANAEAVGGPTPDGPWRESTVEVERRPLTDDDVVAIVRAELEGLRVAGGEMSALGQKEEVERLTAQAAVLEQLLQP